MVIRMKKKNKIIVIKAIGGVAAMGVVGYLFLNSTDSNPLNVKNPYSEEAIKEASKYELDDNLVQYTYSKTLEVALTSGLFVEDYFVNYVNIDYVDTDNFINDVNDLLSKGYTNDEVNEFFDLNNQNKKKLLSSDERIDFIKYSDINYYSIDNIQRYDKYIEDNGSSIEDAILKVNMNLDKPFYTDTKEVSNPESYDVLINKYYGSSSSYTPIDLVKIPGFDHITFREEPTKQFVKLMEEAKMDGFTFEPTTAYRNYNYQNILYTNYVKKDGTEAADTYSARPGFSEHNIGLAIDIKNPSYYNQTGVRMNDEDYKWILDNSYKYGFIVRYPKDSTPITGYIEEPWHLRYLGVDLATKVVKSKLTYDEYYEMYIRPTL